MCLPYSFVGLRLVPSTDRTEGLPPVGQDGLLERVGVRSGWWWSLDGVSETTTSRLSKSTTGEPTHFMVIYRIRGIRSRSTRCPLSSRDSTTGDVQVGYGVSRDGKERLREKEVSPSLYPSSSRGDRVHYTFTLFFDPGVSDHLGLEIITPRIVTGVRTRRPYSTI